MSYATLADLNAQFGEHEVLMLTDRNHDGVADAAVVDNVLRNASDTIDSFLSARYSLPLASVSSQLVDVCGDIARYKLCGGDARETDAVRARYHDALKTLADIRDGKRDIGLTPSGTTIADIASVHVIGGGRIFDRNSLGDYDAGRN